MEFIKITGRATGQNEEEFNRIYEPFNQEKCAKYVESIRNR